VAAKHVYEIYVRATPEALWETVTDPNHTTRYFSLDRVAGEVVEIDPPRRLVMTWNHTFDDGVTEGPSRVTWEIEPRGAACLLRLVHDDFHGTTRVFEVVGHGWPIVLSSLKSVLETGEHLAIAPSAIAFEATDIDALEHREWGRRSNQRVWALLGDGEPAADDVPELVDAAHASQWHWSYGGGKLEAQRGEWLLSHVYAVIGDARAALRHAQRCRDITEAEGYEDFDRAYACEAMARAYAVSGDSEAAREWRERAVAAGALIADDEDRKIFESDLAS
jgi:uncharacterized protein YndB with AHSA1/START domain